MKVSWKEYKSQGTRNIAVKLYLLSVTEKLCVHRILATGPPKQDLKNSKNNWKVDGGILMGQHSDVNSFKQLAITERDMRSLNCYLISDVKLY